MRIILHSRRLPREHQVSQKQPKAHSWRSFHVCTVLSGQKHQSIRRTRSAKSRIIPHSSSHALDARTCKFPSYDTLCRSGTTAALNSEKIWHGGDQHTTTKKTRKSLQVQLAMKAARRALSPRSTILKLMLESPSLAFRKTTTQHSCSLVTTMQFRNSMKSARGHSSLFHFTTSVTRARSAPGRLMPNATSVPLRFDPSPPVMQGARHVLPREALRCRDTMSSMQRRGFPFDHPRVNTAHQSS